MSLLPPPRTNMVNMVNTNSVNKQKISPPPMKSKTGSGCNMLILTWRNFPTLHGMCLGREGRDAKIVTRFIMKLANNILAKLLLSNPQPNLNPTVGFYAKMTPPPTTTTTETHCQQYLSCY